MRLKGETVTMLFMDKICANYQIDRRYMYLKAILTTGGCLPLSWGYINIQLLTSMNRHYTIIDFNEVDIRIYLPEKLNFTFEGR